MKAYIVTTEPPQIRWTLAEAKGVIDAKHQNPGGESDLSWDENSYRPGEWTAHLLSGWDDTSTELDAKVYEVDLPSGPPVVRRELPEGTAVLMEMRVTTATGAVAYETQESAALWGHSLLSHGTIVQAFAEKAGRFLGEQLNGESA